MDNIKYHSIAIGLLYKGTYSQKVVISSYIENFEGDELTEKIKQFIDEQIKIGGIELN